MRSLRIELAYDGTAYCGWQSQAVGRSIQDTFELAWCRVTREQVRVAASGRTDAGVHAVGQVVSLQTATSLTPETLRRALNANLPDDIRVREVAEATIGFHATRDACWKRYRYRIQMGSHPDIFEQRYAWFIPQRLDSAAMREAAGSLVGEHDFAAFQASGSPRRNTVRNVRRLTVDLFRTELVDGVQIEIEANGFLYNMVRNIVGSLVEVGRGRQPAEWVGHVLNSRDRRQAGPTAPARGLTLVFVAYPPLDAPPADSSARPSSTEGRS